MPISAFDDSAMETVAGVFGLARAALDPACAAASFVGRVEILRRERLAGAEQFDDGFAELHAGGPGFVHAGAGEHVGGAGALADAGVAVAGEVRLAVAAGFLQRFGAPGAQRAVLEMRPQRGMLDVVLQIAVGGARGVVIQEGTKMPTETRRSGWT